MKNEMEQDILKVLFSEEEIQRLTNYVLPKMVIGGVVSVSIVSVIIAAYIGPMIFGA